MTEVSPFDIPKKMTPEQLEYWIIFGVCVANKSAEQTEKKLKSFLNILSWDEFDKSIFKQIQHVVKTKELLALLKQAKLGQYKRISRAFKEVTKLDTKELLRMRPRAAVSVLEGIYGIGPKTARMIVLYAWPDADVVPLDTHVLKWLKAQGYQNVPKSTPSAGKKYTELEEAFQFEAKARNKTVRQLDTEVWKSYAQKPF